MNAKVTAVILAVIIVAAGAVVYLTRDDSSGDITPGKLLIYGNADGDYDIDQDDVAYLEDIIAGKKEKTDMADANCDGDINQEDIDLVKKLINKVPCTAYYYDQQNKCHESFSYPIKNTRIPVGWDPRAKQSHAMALFTAFHAAALFKSRCSCSMHPCRRSYRVGPAH